jgi:hypothetical protein
MSSDYAEVKFLFAIKLKTRKKFFPNLHILIGKEESNYVGFCLNNSIFYKSRITKEIRAVAEISYNILKASIESIRLLFSYGMEALIFDNEVTDAHLWNIYNNSIKQMKIEYLNKYFGMSSIDKIKPYLKRIPIILRKYNIRNIVWKVIRNINNYPQIFFQFNWYARIEFEKIGGLSRSNKHKYYIQYIAQIVE